MSGDSAGCERRDRMLDTIRDASRALRDAESREAVAETVADASTDLFPGSVAVVYLFDTSDGVLVPATVDGEHTDDPSLDAVVPEQGGAVERVFLTGETVRTDLSDSPALDLSLTEALLAPIGDYGVCVAGGDSGTSVAEAPVETLTAAAATALGCLEREGRLGERTAELETRDRRLDRLRQVGATVSELDRTLARAETRVELERALCRHLSTTDGIDLVRVSRYDPEGARLVARECEAGAGARGDDSLGTLPVEVEETTEPAARAVVTGEPVHVPNTADRLHEEPWRKAALSRGVRSVLSLPLAYRSVPYGALTLCTGQESLLDDLSRPVLAHVGREAATAVNAVEHRNAALSGQARELTVRFTDERIPLYQIAVRADCSLALGPAAPRSGGDLLTTARVEGADPGTVVDVATELTAVSEASPGTGAGERDTVELCLSTAPVFEFFADRGVRVLDSTADPDSAEFTLSVSDTVDIRALFETLTARYESPELAGKRHQTPSPRTDDRYRSELTPRQEEVLETAHENGFFESPRACTGEDVADELGVSPQTVYRHIRTAEATLFDIVFDNAGEL